VCTPDIFPQRECLVDQLGGGILSIQDALEYLSGVIVNFWSTDQLSGGGQGKAPKPPCKREGSQDRARREKIVVPQTPKPPRKPKGGK
jgi:hypothetical protein